MCCHLHSRCMALNAAAQPIRIGELNIQGFSPRLSRIRRHGLPCRDKRCGPVLGRPVEIVSRDDNGNPATPFAWPKSSCRVKRRSSDGNVRIELGLAVADLAKQRKVLFLASEALPTRSSGNGNKYTFRLRASTYMQTAMLAPEAARLAKSAGRSSIRITRRAIGHGAFKKQMIALQAGA